MVHKGDIAEHIMMLPARILYYDGNMAIGNMPKTRMNKFRSCCLKAEQALLFFFMVRLRLIDLFPPNPALKDINKRNGN